MYGRACRNLSLWRKYKTNIDTLLLIFAFFNEKGSSDIQYRSRSRNSHFVLGVKILPYISRFLTLFVEKCVIVWYNHSSASSTLKIQ